MFARPVGTARREAAWIQQKNVSFCWIQSEPPYDSDEIRLCFQPGIAGRDSGSAAAKTQARKIGFLAFGA